jgi:hypothetical protein
MEDNIALREFESEGKTSAEKKSLRAASRLLLGDEYTLF